MMAEDIEPEKHLEHPNEYVTEEDLVEAKLFEFEQEEKWRIAQEEMEGQQQEKERQQEQEGPTRVDTGEGEQIVEEAEVRSEDPVTKEAEEGLQEQLQDAAENAMDVLDDEDMFEVLPDEDA